MRRLVPARPQVHRLHRGVYSVGPRGPDAPGPGSWQQCWHTVPGRFFSHRSAGRASGRCLRSASGIEVTTPRGKLSRACGITRPPLARSLHDEDRAILDGIPVTSPARTLVDLADVLSERRLAGAFHEAEVQRVLDLGAVERTLARLSGRNGSHRLRRVIAAYDGGPPMTRSEAEVRFLQMCSEHALPTPQANVSVGGYEVDFHWRDAGLVVEVDGAAAHHTRRAFHEDRKPRPGPRPARPPGAPRDLARPRRRRYRDCSRDRRDSNRPHHLTALLASTGHARVPRQSGLPARCRSAERRAPGWPRASAPASASRPCSA